MRIDIITSVPELLTSPLNESILKRAQDKGLVEIVVHNLHDYAHDRRNGDRRGNGERRPYNNDRRSYNGERRPYNNNNTEGGNR